MGYIAWDVRNSVDVCPLGDQPQHMKFILGTKCKMLTVFTDDGRAFAATVINAAPNVVTQQKTVEKDGYKAVQLAAGETKEKRVNKAQLGHAKGKAFKHFKEERDGEGEVGAVIDVSAFAPGEKVTVSAISKGRGFQGVVKRHGFQGGPRSHGQKHSERSPGSIGGSGGRAGGRVAKGMRMAGRMGGVQKTIRGLKIMKIDAENNVMAIKGAVPGNKSSLVTIQGQ